MVVNTAVVLHFAYFLQIAPKYTMFYKGLAHDKPFDFTVYPFLKIRNTLFCPLYFFVQVHFRSSGLANFFDRCLCPESCSLVFFHH